MPTLLRILFLLMLLSPSVCLAAQTKISQMPDGGATQQGDTVPVVRGGVNLKTQFGATSTGNAGDIQLSNGASGFNRYDMASNSGGNPPSPFYNYFGALKTLSVSTWLTYAANTVNEFYQAASLLYFVSQGMDIDPRLNGASANGIFFGQSYGTNNPITTTASSTHISAFNYLFKQGTACASASCTGDVGKRICISASTDVGPCSCIASVNNDGTAELSVPAWASTTGGFAVMAGYPTDPSNPLTCADDTIPIQNSSSIQAIFHGGAVKLPTRSTFHKLRMQTGTWLKGDGAGNWYPGIDSLFGLGNIPLNGSPRLTTVAYCGTTGYNTDSETCIDASSGYGLRFSDFLMQGIVFPYAGYKGLTVAGIGVGQTGTFNDVEHTLVEHVTFALLPVGIGTAFSYDWPITVTGSIAPGPGSQGTLTITSVTSNQLNPNYPEIAAYGLSDFPAINRVITGTNIPANTTIVSALQAGTTGTYIVSASATTSSETITLPSGGGMSGTYRHNQFGPIIIGMNGPFTDMSETEGVYTGDFVQYGWYLHGGSEARKLGGRFEEIQGSAVYLNGYNDARFTGVHWQSNVGANITLAGCCAGGLQITGGGMQSGGIGSRAQGAMIEVTGSYYSVNVDGVNLQPGASSYLFRTTTSAGQFGIGPFSVDGGNGDAAYPFSGHFTALGEFSRGFNHPAWRQNIEGWPKIDTTLTGTMGGYSVTGIVGGANYSTGTAASTTATGTIALTGMKPVFNSYYCDGGDYTAGIKCAMNATTSTSCSLGCTTTVTSGDKIWIKSGEGN